VSRLNWLDEDDALEAEMTAHDAEPWPHSDHDDDAPKEDYTMDLEDSARIVSECRAAGGSAADAWEALKAARRAAKLAVAP
jgi:hypothetical protein